jgi:DNA repair exonuclease SbcCD ATPase subunit
MQKNIELESKIEFLQAEIRELTEEKEYYRGECNKHAEDISEFLDDINRFPFQMSSIGRELIEKWKRRKE